MSALAQTIPVVSKTVFHAVRSEANALLGFPTNVTLPMLRPFVLSPPGFGDALCVTPMRHRDDWALALFLPNRQSFFVMSSGRLLYNFNPKVKECTNDSNATACRVWNGTILGVEHTGTNWFAADAFCIAGKPLLHLPFSERRKELKSLKDCMPTLQFVDDLDDPQGSRLWDKTRTLN